MARLSAARRAALRLVGERRRRGARIRELARTDDSLASLSAADRALAFRLAIGTTAAETVLDKWIDEFLRRPSSLEPRVRDALRLSAYELLYLETPTAVAASQGVELVRSVAPRATGLANALLRRLAQEVRPRAKAARQALDSGTASVDELSLASGLPLWLVEQVLADRGASYAISLCEAQLEPAPVYVATNARRHSPEELERMLSERGMDPHAIAGLSGAFALSRGAELGASEMVSTTDLVVADFSSQLVCRIGGPEKATDLLEVGQGRGTKSLLLATASHALWPARIAAVDSVAYKVDLSRRRMEVAGLGDIVSCHELDARMLAGSDLSPELQGPFAAVLLDAPCSGTGTLRRHPEIPSTISKEDVEELADLQLSLLSAAASRVCTGGVVTYATCSVLRAEDEDVVTAFLKTELGRSFAVEAVSSAYACTHDEGVAALVAASQTADGFFLATPAPGAGDGHFCARLRRQW